MGFPRRPLTAALAVAFTASTTTFAAAADNAHQLTDLVVSAKREQTLPAGMPLDDQRLRPLSAASSDSASLLRELPGLELQTGGGVSSLPVMHGLADDRIRIQIDDMDLVSACANHMNPPLSYIDPSRIAAIDVLAGLTPVSAGGDSIAGTIRVAAAAPEFAAPGQGVLSQGQLGGFYRSNGQATGGNLQATLAGENFSLNYSAATVDAGNYQAGGDFKPAGLAYVKDGRSIRNANHALAGNDVGSTMYRATNQELGLAFRQENHLLELKAGIQDIPRQGFVNQRMDMTANDSQHALLRYTGRYDWGNLQASAFHEHTRHKMNFLDDKAYWYMGNAPGMPMDTEGWNNGAKIKAEIALSARDLVRVGGELQNYRLDDWWSPSGKGGMYPNTFLNINHGERNRRALFGEWEASWNSHWLTQIGLRHEAVSTDTGQVAGYNANYKGDANAFNQRDRRRNDDNWDLTAIARYSADASHSLEFGYARKTRSPNLYERYSWSTGGMAMNMVNLVGDGNGYVGNPDLKPEIAHTLSASLAWRDVAQDGWRLKLTPYVSYVENYINARRCLSSDSKMASSPCKVASNLSRDNNFVFLKYINQDALLYGFDLSGEMPLLNRGGHGNLKATGVVSYVRGQTSDGANLYNQMPLNARLALKHQQANWQSSAEWVLVSRKEQVAQERNELKTAGYALLNLRTSYTWQQIRLDLGIENVFDRLYYHPLGGAYLGQGTTMPPLFGAPYGIAVPGMGRSIYAGMTLSF